jgi:cobalamin biosynthesis protein CobW
MKQTERVPATIVTGFLGAGKTTLIRNLIAQANGRRIALIVNEFGDMGFDGELLADCGDSECRPTDVIELTNGCICCTVAEDFVPTMEKLLARDPAPDHIVIETSGLALPQPLVQAFNWPSVRHRVTVDGVVTVIDAAAVAEGRFAPDAEAVTAARADDPSVEHDNPIEELYEDQLRCADLIVLSKCDLLDGAALGGVEIKVAADVRPGTRMLKTSGNGLKPEALLGLDSETETQIASRPSHHEMEGEEHEHDDFETFIAHAAEAESLEALKARVGRAMAMAGVLRVKGRAVVRGKAAPAIVQAVGPRVDAYFAPNAGAPGLVVIGSKGIDHAAIRAVLDG